MNRQSGQFQTYSDQPRNRTPTPEELRQLDNRGFESKQEMADYVGDSRYKTDSCYRGIIEDILKKTDPAILNLVREAPVDHTGEFLERKDAVQQQFDDPRYKTSALYRKSVAEQVQKFSPGQTADPKGGGRVEIAASGDAIAKLTPFSVLTIRSAATITGPNAPEKIEVRGNV